MRRLRRTLTAGLGRHESADHWPNSQQDRQVMHGAALAPRPRQHRFKVAWHLTHGPLRDRRRSAAKGRGRQHCCPPRPAQPQVEQLVAGSSAPPAGGQEHGILSAVPSCSATRQRLEDPQAPGVRAGLGRASASRQCLQWSAPRPGTWPPRPGRDRPTSPSHAAAPRPTPVPYPPGPPPPVPCPLGRSRGAGGRVNDPAAGRRTAARCHRSAVAPRAPADAAESWQNSGRVASEQRQSGRTLAELG